MVKVGRPAPIHRHYSLDQLSSDSSLIITGRGTRQFFVVLVRDGYDFKFHIINIALWSEVGSVENARVDCYFEFCVLGRAKLRAVLVLGLLTLHSRLAFR